MARPVARRGKWNPLFVRALRAVHLRGEAIDLGGIGKGLAVGRCAIELARDRRDFLIDAGGDCYCAGRSAGGTPWRVGVEDPFGGADPVAVLEVSDRAVATSSTRLRHWRVGATQVHHLIDPATGQPGGTGLRSVTVVGPEPAWAEVWAKVLFLRGRDGIAGAAEHGQLEALWIDDQGEVGVSGALGPTMIWSRS
jgi:thiamine biosynthesis lipoprotein